LVLYLMMLPDTPFAYSPKEFGELIGAGESTIFKRIAQGRLRAVKDGRMVPRILRADAEAYLASLPAVTPRRPKP
jgi:excisionase family DNA binding protein